MVSTPRVCVGTTCRNAALTIHYALSSATRQCGVDLAFVIVDAESTDGTLVFAEKVLRQYPHKIIKVRCNIPEGRNLVLKYALDFDPDYIFFLDADVVLLYRNLIELAARVSRGEAVVAISHAYKFFTSREELDSWCRQAVESTSQRAVREEDVIVRKTKWCSLGAALVPRRVAEKIELDTRLNFSEDREFGFKIWLSGYKILELTTRSGEPLAVDVNLCGEISSIYLRLSVREYLSNLSVKILFGDVWHCYSGNFMKTLVAFLRSEHARRYLLHISLDVALVGCLVFAPWLLPVVLAGPAFLLARWCRRRGVRLRDVPRQILKFNLYSLGAVVLFPWLYLKHRRVLDKAYRNYLTATGFIHLS